MQFLAMCLALLLLQSVRPPLNSGVITGHLSNGDGTPAVNVRVGALMIGDTGRQAEALMTFTQTDDAGRYRLDRLAPGRYLLIAGPLDMPAYYPGVGSREHAEIVTVAEGKTIGPFDFKTGFVVSGTIDGLTGTLSALVSGRLQLKHEGKTFIGGKGDSRHRTFRTQRGSN